MSIRIEGKTVTVEERDPHGRQLSWVYHRNTYHRSTTSTPLYPFDLGQKPVSQAAFAGAFWREWKREKGL